MKIIIKVTTSITITLYCLAILIGCGSSDKEPIKSDLTDKVAEMEFNNYLNNNKIQIKKIIIDNKLILTEDNFIESLILTKPTSDENSKGFASGNAILHVKRVLHGIDIDELIILWFVRKNKQWFLIVDNGYLTTLGGHKEDALNLPPKLHEDFKKLFRHIEFEDWISTLMGKENG